MSRLVCPEHETVLSGGPVLYTCSTGAGHTVRAADLDHEYHAPEAVAS